jgi:hypothetical protein
MKTNDEMIISLSEIIQTTRDSEWRGMRDSCIKRAEDFSLLTFKRKL